MSQSVEGRFWAKVDVSAGPDGCWPWLGGTDGRGYGLMTHRPTRRASRIAYGFAHGPVPEGMDVLHRCDNPPCVNPRHLWLGTAKDNVADAVLKGRWSTAERLRPEAVQAARDAFVQGQSLRAISRMTGLARNTVAHYVGHGFHTKRLTTTKGRRVA